MVTWPTNLLWLWELCLLGECVIHWLVVQVLPRPLLGVQVDILGEAASHLEQVIAAHTVRVVVSVDGLLHGGKVLWYLDKFGNTGSLQLYFYTT